MRRLAPLACLLLTTVSTPLHAQTLSADEKELAAYRLTMPTVKKVAAATVAMAEEEKRDPIVIELAKIKAEMKVYEDKDELTAADEAALEKLAERGAALEQKRSREQPDLGPNSTLDDMEARIRKHPKATAILAREGIAPREYVRCMMALLQAAMVEGFSQGKADLAKLPGGVNPENIKFVRENKAELEAMQKMMGDKSDK